MAEEDVTLGELSRGLGSLESRINAQFSEVKRQLESLQFVPRETYEVQMAQVRQDIADLVEARKWMFRTLVAAFLFPVAVAVIALMVSRW